MTAHDDVYLYAAQRAVIAVVALKGMRHKARRRTVAWTVVGNFEIVIDGFRNMKTTYFVSEFGSLLLDDVGGFGSVVTTDVKEETNVVFLKLLDHYFDIFD